MIETIDKTNYKNISLTSSILTSEELNHEFQTNPFATYLLYKKSNKVLGYLYYSDIYERAEINVFKVDKNFQNQKIGNNLLKYLTEKLNKSITLEVRQDNQVAIHLYEKYGFKKVAIRKEYYQEIDAILMIKDNQ